MTRSLLILGGTAWLGASLAREAVARGWDVTCLARGESGTVPDGARLVRADRDEPAAYASLADHRFDAAIEVSWQPRHVREAAEAFAGRVAHWTYVSSVAAYAPGRWPTGEEAPLHAPVERDECVDHSKYDQAKVRCELDTVASHPDALLVRAGVIVGPGDPTERFSTWPRRAARAGADPILLPGGAALPLQVIDVRDLVAWMLLAIDAGRSGPVNTVGTLLPYQAAIGEVCDLAGATGERVHVDTQWLLDQGVRPWKGERSLGLWAPDDGGGARVGVHTHDLYLATGGMLRPLAETVRDILEEERALGVDRETGETLSRDEELRLIDAARAAGVVDS